MRGKNKFDKILIYLILAVLLLLIILTNCAENNNRSVSYWLWAGITPEDAPPNSEYYIFQGSFDTKAEETVYTRLGLYPHPLKSKKVVLVYRIENQLPDVNYIIDLFLQNVTHWQSHPVKIAGVQLDFDSPTSKLPEYSLFLKKLRENLPAEYMLSITGLGDWLYSDQVESLLSISSIVDEIVFQLYQGRVYLDDFDKFILKLRGYPKSFRIGLLDGVSTPDPIENLESNPNYKGIIYFIQKN